MSSAEFEHSARIGWSLIRFMLALDRCLDVEAMLSLDTRSGDQRAVGIGSVRSRGDP